ETTLYGWVYFYHTDGTQLGYSYIGAPAGNEEASLSTSFTATCQSADTLVIRVNRSSGCGSYLGVAQTSTLSNDNDVEPNGTASFDMNAVQETFNEFEEFSGQIGYDNAENGVDVNDWFYYISPRNGNPSVHITYDATFTGWIYLYQKDGTQLGYSQIAVPANNEEPTLTTSYTAMCQAADTLLIRVARAGGCGSYFGHAETSVLANATDVSPNTSLAEASEVFV